VFGVGRLEALQQQPGGHLAHLPGVVVDHRDRRVPPARQLGVLVADHRQVVGYRHRTFPQGRERAVGRLVVRDQQGGGPPPGRQRQQGLHRGRPGVGAERDGQRQLVPHMHARGLHGQPVALHPLASRRHVRRPGDDRDSVMARLQQVLGGRTAAGDLVAEHAVARRVPRPPGQVHGGRAELAQFLRRRAVRTHHDHARGAVIDQGVQGRPLVHRVAARDGQHELVAAPRDLPLHDLGDGMETRVDQVGDH